MAIKIQVGPLKEVCDLCRQIDDTRPMLQIAATSRFAHERSIIWVHLDEFEKRLAKLKAKAAKA